MSKIGQFIIAQEEAGNLIYDEELNEYRENNAIKKGEK